MPQILIKWVNLIMFLRWALSFMSLVHLIFRTPWDCKSIQLWEKTAHIWRRIRSLITDLKGSGTLLVRIYKDSGTSAIECSPTKCDTCMRVCQQIWIITPHVSDVMGVILLTSSVCVCVCVSMCASISLSWANGIWLVGIWHGLFLKEMRFLACKIALMFCISKPKSP